jgi:hypothetical protein
LIERYPSYIFTASQAQQYEWLLQIYPDLFKQIQEKSKSGQWEVIGGVSKQSHLLGLGRRNCFAKELFAADLTLIIEFAELGRAW